MYLNFDIFAMRGTRFRKVVLTFGRVNRIIGQDSECYMENTRNKWAARLVADPHRGTFSTLQSASLSHIARQRVEG